MRSWDSRGRVEPKHMQQIRSGKDAVSAVELRMDKPVVLLKQGERKGDGLQTCLKQ